MNATVRSLDDAKAKQAMLSQYIAECERIERWRSEVNMETVTNGEFDITPEERCEVFERRRDRLENQLKNAGIRLHAEAAETLPSIARAQATLTEKELTP